MTAFVAFFSAIFMYGVYLYNLKLSKKVNSKSLYSAAQDNRSDALVSIGAMIGIIGAYFGIGWLDPLAAFVVGLIICKTAWGIFKEAALDLTDAFEVKKLKEIEDTIRTHTRSEACQRYKGPIAWKYGHCRRNNFCRAPLNGD